MAMMGMHETVGDMQKLIIKTLAITCLQVLHEWHTRQAMPSMQQYARPRRARSQSHAINASHRYCVKAPKKCNLANKCEKTLAVANIR